MAGTAAHRTLDDIESLVASRVIDEELEARLRRNDRALALCWCGYDIAEHNIDAIEYGDRADAPIQDHWFTASGTKRLSWLLSVDHGLEPFEHVHEEQTDGSGRAVTEFCVVCHIEAHPGQETPATSRLSLPPLRRGKEVNDRLLQDTPVAGGFQV